MSEALSEPLPPDLLSAGTVARILGVSKAYIYELAQTWQPDDLRIPSIRIGRVVRFKATDVERYIEERRAA